ncbi:hypothetical protein DVH05_020995 [Phytophthora capsici]|nr:hypothetical protein DVH05_020995 [Phytophthora capsici]
MTQERPRPSGNELAIVESGQLMAATEGAPKTYAEAATSADQDNWKDTIANDRFLELVGEYLPLGKDE